MDEVINLQITILLCLWFVGIYYYSLGAIKCFFFLPIFGAGLHPHGYVSLCFKVKPVKNALSSNAGVSAPFGLEGRISLIVI